MPQGTVEVCALYDYSPSHTDELSFKKGDILTVLRLLDGGWWEGSLNGMVGWFPSNYVTLVPDAAKKPEVPNCNEPILLHLQSFQDEIVQHILEGEIRHINELTNLVHTFLVNLEPLDNLPFLDKVLPLKDLLIRSITMHQEIASSLDRMKHSSETKRVGKLFLDFAPTMNSIGCDYSKVHLYVLTGIAKESEAIARHFSSVGMRFQMDRCSQQLCLIFDRLGRYPLLLKEVERYLENPHVDRDDIQKAMNVYSEIAERCAILRKFKEYDIEILLSVINGWQGPSIAHLGDPILTLRVVLTRVEDSPDHPLPNVPTSQPIPNGRRSVLVIFPTCVLLLARTAQPNTYEFMTKLTLNRLTVLRSMDKETDINLITASSSMNSRDSVRHCRFSLTCTDQNARDLLFSTLTDLIHYQTLIEQPSDGRGVCSSVPALSDLTDGCSSSQQKDNKSAGPSDACCDSTNSDETQNPPLTAPRKSTSPKTSSVSHSGSNPHSSLNGGTPASITGFGPSMEATTAASDVLSSSTQHANAPSTKTDCSLSCRPLPPQLHTELHFLPHQLTTHAHVQSLVALEHRAEENARPLPPGALRCLRLDGPLPMLRSNWPQRVHSSYLHPSGPSPFVPGTQKSDVEIHRAGRPRSPKEDTMKDHRRKKSDRQKSAINVDDVLRSVGRLQDIERRNADAAMVLQVVEAYCANAWTQLGCRSHSGQTSSNNNPDSHLHSSTLSPTESRTLLEQCASSPHGASPFEQCSEVIPATSEAPASRKRGVQGHTFSKGVLQRSGSRGKADISATDETFSHAPSSEGLAPESVVRSMSPPPVILPTRSGRRL